MIDTGTTVSILTPSGQSDARIVGFEAKDVSRNGSDNVVPFYCLEIDGQSFWRWVPADAVEARE